MFKRPLIGEGNYFIIDGYFGNPRSKNGLFVNGISFFSMALFENVEIDLGEELSIIFHGENKDQDDDDTDKTLS